jgi:hypothetical protein
MLETAKASVQTDPTATIHRAPAENCPRGAALSDVAQVSKVARNPIPCRCPPSHASVPIALAAIRSGSCQLAGMARMIGPGRTAQRIMPAIIQTPVHKFTASPEQAFVHCDAV